KVENIFPIDVSDRHFGFEACSPHLIRIDRGVILLLASVEPIALLPLPDLAALTVISGCAFKIGIEPETKGTVLDCKGAGQIVFAEHLTPDTVPIVAVDPVTR